MITTTCLATSGKSSTKGLMHNLIILILIFLLLLVETECAVDSGNAHFPVLDFLMTVLSDLCLKLCDHSVHNDIFDLRCIIHELLD